MQRQGVKPMMGKSSGQLLVFLKSCFQKEELTTQNACLKQYRKNNDQCLTGVSLIVLIITEFLNDENNRNRTVQ